MATLRCPECNASHPLPADPTVTTMRCPYCGAAVIVPDVEARRRFLLEQQREDRLREQHRVAAEREARREAREAQADVEAGAERAAERRERRRGRWGTRLVTLIAVLAAPTIIAVTVYDLPARLGFGASGADRLAQMTTQLRAIGCTTIAPIRSRYATATVSTLIGVQAGCLRVLAAGAGDHRTLGLRLFAADGALLGTSQDTIDPQLAHCTAAAATLRYEIVVGPAGKGRLSHTVLACPDTGAPTAPTAPPAAAGKRR